jgi:dihydrofolate reductase
MPALRVHNFALSLDGYAAGPDQSLDHPLGIGGRALHDWAFATRSFRRMHGMEGGEGGLDDRYAAEGDQGIGATIMGRNMFGPIRGDWGDGEWRGWWGENPPFHHPVFVLTHHPRGSIELEGGTTFHFVDDGIEAALGRAREAAGRADVRLGGGVTTLQQYLRAGLIDHLHLAVVPVLLGRGERLFDHLGEGPAGYECTEWASSPSALHVRLARAASPRSGRE